MNFLYEKPSYLTSFVEQVKTKSDAFVPLEDGFAYLHFPEYNFVYNKLWLSQVQGIESYPVGVASSGNINFPMFVKPIYNLRGMSCDVGLVEDETDFYNLFREHNGKFVMPYLQGDHLSIDVFMSSGQPVWEVFSRGYKAELGKFNYWKVLCNEEITEYHNLLHKVTDFIRSFLKGYTGVINLEFIGDSIIECHLRPSSDLYPLYNRDFFGSLVELYDNGTWNYSNKVLPCYAIPCHTMQYRQINNIDEVFARIKHEFDVVDIVPKLYDKYPDYTDGPKRFLMVYTQHKEDIPLIKLLVNKIPLK